MKSAEVYYVLEGRGLMHVGDETAEVAAGQAVYIPPGAVQFIENRGGGPPGLPPHRRSGPGRRRTKRSYEAELGPGVHVPQISQLPALVLEPDVLDVRDLDGIDGPGLPRLRPDQVPGLPRARRLRGRGPDLAVHALRGGHRRPGVAPDPARHHPDGDDAAGVRHRRPDLPALDPDLAHPRHRRSPRHGQRLRGPGPAVLRPGDGRAGGHDQRHRPELGHVQHGHGRRPRGRGLIYALLRPGLVLRHQRRDVRRRDRRPAQDAPPAVRAAGPSGPRPWPTSRRAAGMSPPTLIRTIIGLIGVISLFGISFVTLFPAWAVNVLHGDAKTNGFLQSARGLGALCRGPAHRLARPVPLPRQAPDLRDLRPAGRHRGLRAGPLDALLAVSSSSGPACRSSSSSTWPTPWSRPTRPTPCAAAIMSVYTLVFFGLLPLGSLGVGVTAEQARPAGGHPHRGGGRRSGRPRPWPSSCRTCARQA
ncbi:MAG: cupin domain-containing protein [Desulfobacterales bacterium]|nr:cupin domain-containing protein [Desulfobacterales bacterium]